LTRNYPNYFLKIKFLLKNNFGIRPNFKNTGQLIFGLDLKG